MYSEYLRLHYVYGKIKSELNNAIPFITWLVDIFGF
jgi:hypothetical protein